MKEMNWAGIKAGVVVACIAVAGVCWDGSVSCHAQTPPPNMAPELQEVLKLSQAHNGDDVIVAYINNTGVAYHLSADDITYLNSQGVSQKVISALLQSKPAVSAAPAPAAVPPPPASAPAPTEPPPSGPPPADASAQPPGPEINFNYFHDQLAPYGSWIQVGDAMYWRPDSAIRANPDWRPYYDMGQWIETDNGLFWQSDYQWGDIPFHYGRWVLDPTLGWLWAPDYTWGPAWVFWRHAETDGAIGWAPLPVGAVFVDGVFLYRGARVGVDFEFGLGVGAFVFVDYGHFHEGFFRMRGREYAYHIHGDRLNGFYRRSVVRNEFRRDEHGRFVNNGIGRDRMARFTKVEHARMEERNPVGDRNKLAQERAKTAGKEGGKPGGAAGAGGEKAAASKPAAAAVSKAYRPPAPAQRSTASASSSSSGSKKK